MINTIKIKKNVEPVLPYDELQFSDSGRPTHAVLYNGKVIALFTNKNYAQDFSRAKEKQYPGSYHCFEIREVYNEE